MTSEHTTDKRPRWTIGMATAADLSGCYFTVQALRLYHRIDDCELLIVDNAPQHAIAPHLRSFCEKTGTRYIPLASPIGTSPARNAIVEHARGDWVLVLDCHVLLVPGALEALRAFAAEKPESRDLLQGPLLYDDGRGLATHFEPQWRDGMFGVWGHDPRGDDPRGEPFEIPAQGLGLFACRRDAWPGFHRHAGGFGGEEGYIHEKFRRRGGRCLCIPALRWMHRFGYPAGAPYPLRMYDRVRNYVLEWLELGRDLEEIRAHFVEGGRLAARDWEHLIADPEKHVDPPTVRSGCGGCRASKHDSIDAWFADEAARHPDLRGHLPRLRELAEGADLVVELGVGRGGSTAAFLAARPRRLISIDAVRPNWHADAAALVPPETDWEFREGDSRSVELPEPIDLLFIDTKHTAPQLWAELEAHAGKVRGRIALHDTKTYGEHGEGGGPGLLPALRRFLRERPEWVVAAHYPDWHGLTVISNRAEDKKPLPSTARQVFNFAKAVAAHVIEGGATPADELERRLDICALCELRSGNRCSVCGCYLIAAPTGKGGKAEWAEQECPLGKWPPVAAKKGEKTGANLNAGS
ncbi:hypothetical protein JCM19992_16240 [Thermostilla marina]